MTEVVDVNLSDEIELTKEGEEDAKFSCDIDSLIESEAKKLMKLNINNALDEIQTEDRLSIILQGWGESNLDQKLKKKHFFIRTTTKIILNLSILEWNTLNSVKGI